MAESCKDLRIGRRDMAGSCTHRSKRWRWMAVSVVVCITTLTITIALVSDNSGSENPGTARRTVSAADRVVHLPAPRERIESMPLGEVGTAVRPADSAAATPQDAPREADGGAEVEVSVDETGPSRTDRMQQDVLPALRSLFSRKSASGNGNPDEARLAALDVLFDQGSEPKERRRAAWLLARDANSVDTQVWSDLLMDPSFPDYLKATVAEALGHSSVPETRDLVTAALSNPSEAVVRGAIKGLSAIGGKDSIERLSDLMYSPKSSAGIREEAARGLGRIEDPQAMEVLVGAYAHATFAEDMEFRAEILSTIGQRESDEESVGFLQNVLDDEATAGSLRLAAITALQDYSGEVGPLLLKYLSAQDSDIREEAAWVLSVAEQPGELSPELLGLLAGERDAAVRKRLYQALGNQEQVDLLAVKAQVQRETDRQAKVSGYGLILENLKDAEGAGIGQWADEVAIPELCEIVMTADTLNERLEAVIALQKARTPEADAALQGIAMVSVDQRILDAIAGNTGATH
jgi:HEAT repeat protein